VESQSWNDCAVVAYATLLQISYAQARYRLRAVYNPDTGCQVDRLCKILRKRHGAREVWPLNKKRKALLLLNWGGANQWGHVVLYVPTQGVVGDIWGRDIDKHLARVMELP